MTVEDLKAFVIANKKGLIVGAVAALLLRGLIR